MSWQLYENPRLSARSTRLWLSLQKTGSLQLSRALVQALVSTAVRLYFDPEGPRIALEPVPEEDPHAVFIKKATKQESYSITAISFFNRFGIVVQQARQVPVRQEDGRWVADFRGVEGVTVAPEAE